MKTFLRILAVVLAAATLFLALYYVAYRSAGLVKTGNVWNLQVLGFSTKATPAAEKIFYQTFYPLIRLSEFKVPEKGFSGTIVMVSRTYERFAVKVGDGPPLLINAAKDRVDEIAALKEGDKVSGSYAVRNGRNEVFRYYYFLRELKKNEGDESR